ncbi:MAG: hypothetical protein Q8R05_01395 [Candidatus Omnitrophota bacterium]|nr:hypothetical protein [Candidatus Omnitrophota bacterium]
MLIGSKEMKRETSNIEAAGEEPRGWEALEIKLKEKGLSRLEIEEARKSFYGGIEVLTKMFLARCSAEQKSLV